MPMPPKPSRGRSPKVTGRPAPAVSAVCPVGMQAKTGRGKPRQGTFFEPSTLGAAPPPLGSKKVPCRGKPRQGTFFEPSTVGAAPPPRADHCCVALGGHIVLHGGNSAHGSLEDMYALNVGAAARGGAWQWERVSPQGEVPPARFGHSLVRVSDTTAVLFGGADDNEFRLYNDTYTLRFSFEGTPASPGTTRCISIAAGGAANTSSALPTPRCGHSLSLVPTLPPSLVLFGGSNTRGALNDLWTLDPETLSWQPAGAVDGAPPPPRAFHASAMVGRTLVVVGGRNGYEYLRDAYTLNTGLGGGRWARIAWSATGEPFPALAYHHLVTLPGRRLLVFGGFSANGTTALHAAIDIDYSRATWRRGKDMPRARSNHSVVLMGGGAGAESGERGLTVLIFGGFDGHDFCSHLVGLSLSLPAGLEAEAEAVPDSARGRRDSFGTGAGGASFYDRLATGSAARPPVRAPPPLISLAVTESLTERGAPPQGEHAALPQSLVDDLPAELLALVAGALPLDDELAAAQGEHSALSQNL
ncbi:hypothetical protein T492DRAFT_869702, partial [Pavlovales sp. CCMP2436]